MGWRPVRSRVAAVLAGLLVLALLLMPSEPSQLTPAAVLRLPLEGLLGAAILLVLPERARRIAAVLVGVCFCTLAAAKLLDLGFSTVLARPFDPITDWPLLGNAIEFVSESTGRTGAVVVVVATAAVTGVVGLAAVWAVRRLTTLLADHRVVAGRVVAALFVVWAVVALTGVHVVPGVPVAVHELDRWRQLPHSLLDHRDFRAQLAQDAFADVPPEELLTALRGKDVIVAFVESYGRAAVTDPRFASEVGAVLDDGWRRLSARGFDARSAYLTSPVVGGGSWLAHATLLSGVWVDHQQRYRTLVASDRLTLNRAFQQAGWRTLAVMPGVIRDWPEGEFFGYDRVYAAADLDYHGPRFGFAPMPDQYTLSAFQRFERDRALRAPLMVEMALVSSHAPWRPIPELVEWESVGDGSGFVADGPAGNPSDVWQRDLEEVRRDYREALVYTLRCLLSYIETYGDEDLVVIFLGDHQVAPLVTGEDAGYDVPVTVLAGDPAVLERIADWEWEPGLRPSAEAPVWAMDTFRDHFLTAFTDRAP